jgi:hypothetical protein
MRVTHLVCANDCYIDNNIFSGAQGTVAEGRQEKSVLTSQLQEKPTKWGESKESSMHLSTKPLKCTEFIAFTETRQTKK